jgi:DNA-binding transcriptional LysR family regulator
VQLRHLAALVAVTDAGTFTDAASRLGVSQAAVSRSIATLEATLGVRVLHRTTRHVSLTPTGARVAAQARRICDEVAHLRRIVEEPPNEIRIGYAWAALGKHTRRLQKRWAPLHPRVPLVFVQVNDPAAGLADASADTAPGHVEAVQILVFNPLTKAQQRQLREIGRRIMRAIDPDDRCLDDRTSRPSPTADSEKVPA